jgi:hypothetical protein
MSFRSMDEPSGWRAHPFLWAVVFTALVGVSVRFPWWSSWHHWWIYPVHFMNEVRTAWDHPPAK